MTLATSVTRSGGKGLPVPTAYAQTSTDAERSKQTRIIIGSKIFLAALEDNATARAFRALLPMTISMTELNGNEKYFRLNDDLPVNASNPRTIQTGDLMIYGSSTLVLFYKSFPTSNEYTRLGRINDARGLLRRLVPEASRSPSNRWVHEECVGFKRQGGARNRIRSRYGVSNGERFRRRRCGSRARRL